jgi:2-amino-4-hydroxy-6-hydroxymethyldihydropteridine diphosphokinase
MMNNVYLSIGTNMGDRKRNLQEAVWLLTKMDDVNVIRVSSIYETAPVGYTDQAAFLNICVYVQTTKTAAQMLEACQFVEQELGRVRVIRWGPRSIDLDILLFNQENIESEHLIVPHARMYERAFVLLPLMEVIETSSTQLDEASKKAKTFDAEKEGIQLWMESVSVEEFVRFEN